MSGKNRLEEKDAEYTRQSSRVHCLRDITVTYEGQDEHIVVKTPDLSSQGMFISTNRTFAEGAVLNLRFRLAATNAEVRTRCEVRYCLPGVGVGVEFIGIGPEETKAIEQELTLSSESKGRPKKRTARHRRKPR